MAKPIEIAAAKYTADFEKGLVLNAVGKSVGNVGFDGYARFTVYTEGKSYTIRRSRFIFYMSQGYEPAEIDHIDRNKLNDCISNLRACSHNENQGNRSMNDRELPVGVYYKPRMKSRPFEARIQVSGKSKCLGYFSQPQQASEAYQNVKENINVR